MKKLINYTLDDFKELVHKVITELKIIDEIKSTINNTLRKLGVEFIDIEHIEVEDLSETLPAPDRITVFRPRYVYRYYYFVSYVKDNNFYFSMLEFYFPMYVYLEHDTLTGALLKEETSVWYRIWYRIHKLLHKPSSLIFFNSSEQCLSFVHSIEFTKSNIDDELVVKLFETTFEEHVRRIDHMEIFCNIVTDTLTGVLKKYTVREFVRVRHSELLKEYKCQMRLNINFELINEDYSSTFKTYLEVMKKKDLINGCVIDKNILELCLLPHLLHSFL